MKFSDFKASLQNKPLGRNYCFFGPDAYLVNQARELLLHAIQQNLGTEIKSCTVELGEVPLEEILNSALHVPMFEPQQMIVVKGFMRLRENQARKLEEYLGNPSDRTFLVFWAGEIGREEKEKRIFRILAAGTKLVEISPLDEERTKRWIGSKLKAAGFSVDADAIDSLQESHGNNLESLSHEIEKLILFASPAKKISASTVAQSQGFSREHSIDEFLTAILLKKKVAALEVLNEMMSDHSQVIPLISLLSRQLRQLLQIKEMTGKVGISELGKRVGIYSPSATENMMNYSRHFSAHSLFRAINGLAMLDDRIKRSSLDTRLFAELLVHELTN
jgi:DNA polymerase III subunit delta